MLLRLGLWITRRVVGKDLLLARLLAWYPRAAVSSAVLEALIAHQEGRLDERLLKLVRLTVSFTAACPFCMDMNSAEWQQFIAPAEMAALQGRILLDDVPTFTQPERLAIAYARLVSATPLSFPAGFVLQLQRAFTEREIVILAVTAAQVNYWARLIQALGCPPPGIVPGSDLPPLFLPPSGQPPGAES